MISWQKNSAIVANQLVRPSDGNETGFLYQNGAVAGQTGPSEPAWPSPAGSTVADGSVNWTAIAPPAAGEDAVQSSTWTQQIAPDGALTITGITHSSLTATAFIGGGTPGKTYTILVLSTMTSGAIYPLQIVMTID